MDVVGWLVESGEPAVRGMARRDLLGQEHGEDVLSGAIVEALLTGACADKRAYRKYTGAHWRIVSLVELEVPAGEPRAVEAAEYDLAEVTRSLEYGVSVVDGLVRRCGSVEGNTLGACARLGMATDPRVQRLAEGLIEWQWPDGGWNCDRNASGRRSSFHETHSAAWGLHEYYRATGETAAQDAALRAGELFLEHRLFRSLSTGAVIDKRWLRPTYPPYWHYDILQALLVLSRLGLARDERAADALDELEQRRRPDGRWNAGTPWFGPLGGTRSPEVVDWGRSGPNEMITLNALRVLTAAGRRTLP
ncbi:hypothetical protein E0H73_02590 [Kribbella pittospori]|uniref:Squalene cyclase C-terminal domain-containing protein n=1 Tax=Kribbella pittospori TaxID=722689 RepID=A0A4R0KZW9_9ACTN|nr:hypothetical protein [Kribbella pittospori]TCC65837.1 hypothetical protein E0H73_02590 [Kribbella pittospori]